jgi:hypothetical protein
MLSCDFERKLRTLNRNLRIYCGNDDRMAAGIFVVSRKGDFTEICAADKNWVPEYPIFRPDGGYIKAGWRRTLRVLISKKLISKYQAEKLFGFKLEGNRLPIRPRLQQDSIVKKLDNLGVKVIDAGGY